MIFFDTESIGFYGPTVLIQWGREEGPVYLHNIFNEPVGKTLRLIELLAQEELCGYNLSHDSYHINRTYGVLSRLPLSRPPSFADYHDCEQEDEARDSFCVRPAGALDLLLVGRKGEFQSAMKQKDIILKKIPTKLAPLLVEELSKNVVIPEIFFSKSKRGYHWRICPLSRETGKELSPEQQALWRDNQDPDCAPDPHFVNIRLGFSPSIALKIVIEQITGKETRTIDDLRPLPKVEEYAYWPTYGGWLDVARPHVHAWTHDPERLEYAKDDVEYLRILHRYFDCPSAGDIDSELAWSVGAIFWRGYTFNEEAARRRLQEVRDVLEGVSVNYNSPKAVKSYLVEACTILEKQAVKDTKKETLQALVKWDTEVSKRAKQILEARQIDKERDLLEKLLAARRFHAQFKVIGTKSNRMSGGSEGYVTSRGSINPQGIKKDPVLRSIFTLAHGGMVLSGGDFSGYEVSIAEAEYRDPELRKDLLSGKKVHALFAECMYADHKTASGDSVTYDFIVANSEYNDTHPLGFYQRGKRGFFARLYGAENNKMYEVFWDLKKEEVDQGLMRFFNRYTGIKQAQERLYAEHAALRQPDGIGTKVEWHEPKPYVESFLGFRRDFSLEYSICRTLFGMANDSEGRIAEAGRTFRVVRRDRVQSGDGAVRSALYAAAFNLNSRILREGGNHKIQSPGGQKTKELQYRLWEFQPRGIGEWFIMPMNVHDELQSPCKREIADSVEREVNAFIEESKSDIPLIAMEWHKEMENWGEKG